MACGILVAGPGIKPMPPTMEAQSLHHWTSREVPELCLKGSKQGNQVFSWMLDAQNKNLYQLMNIFIVFSFTPGSKQTIDTIKFNYTVPYFMLRTKNAPSQ